MKILVLVLDFEVLYVTLKTALNQFLNCIVVCVVSDLDIRGCSLKYFLSEELSCAGVNKQLQCCWDRLEMPTAKFRRVWDGFDGFHKDFEHVQGNKMATVAQVSELRLPVANKSQVSEMIASALLVCIMKVLASFCVEVLCCVFFSFACVCFSFVL